MQPYRTSRTEKEIKEILKTLTIVIDTREQKNEHITDYFITKGINFELKKLDFADYSCFIPKNEELGISKDMYINTFVERKMGLDELTTNLQKDARTRFENELIRAKDHRFVLFAEQLKFDEDLANGNYRSKYDPKALKGTLESLKYKYGFEIIPMDKRYTGHNIYLRFYYHTMAILKGGLI